MNDGELLQAYDQRQDESAFGELVSRHLGLVHATARRQLGDPHAAADVSQAVFCLLLRKSRRLHHKPDLAGWLHRATCFKAAEASRSERRRRFHEQEAVAMHPGPADHPDPWAELAPHLDEALNRLSDADRQLILCRFYRRQPLRELGRGLGLSDDAARMRVARALERLRRLLAPGGATMATAGLADLLSARLGEPAPDGLHDLILRRARAVHHVARRPSTLQRFADWAADALRRPIALGVAGLALITTLTLWRYGAANPPPPVPDNTETSTARSTRENAPPSAPVARITAMTPKPLSRAELEALLEDLRRILTSPIEDEVYPPEDLRRSVDALAGHPEETFAVLNGTFRGPGSSRAARERAIWGFWLLGDGSPAMLPVVTEELIGVIRSPDESAFWWHAADVLRHLGPPEASLAGVAVALRQNPAAVSSTTRFWEAAAWRYPEATRGWLQPWLAETGSMRFVAARVLVKIAPAESATLLPVLLAGLEEPPHQSSALAALQELGPAAAELAPRLQARLADAERNGEVWLRQQLVEALAAIASNSRAALPEVDQAIRVADEAKVLQGKIQDDTATVSELAAGLQNPKVAWMAALTLEELGPAAAAALPALREALVAPNQTHRTYLAQAIKALAPEEPKPLFDRDDLLATLRVVSETAASLGPSLDEARRAHVAEFVRTARNLTPEELAGLAGELEAVHPQLRAVFVKGLIETDPALRPVLVR